MKPHFFANLGFADISISIGYFLAIELIEDGFHKKLCIAQAHLLQLFSLASIFWTLAIIIFFYQESSFLSSDGRVPFGLALARIRILWRLSAVLCWGLPLLTVITGIALHTNYSQVDGFWCWISKNNHYYRLEWLFFYGPLGLIWIFNIIIFLIHNFKGKVIYSEQAFAILNRLFGGYVLSFIITWTAALVSRLAQLGGETSIPLHIAHYATFPLQGILNLVVYLIVHKDTFTSPDGELQPLYYFTHDFDSVLL